MGRTRPASYRMSTSYSSGSAAASRLNVPAPKYTRSRSESAEARWRDAVTVRHTWPCAVAAGAATMAAARTGTQERRERLGINAGPNAAAAWAGVQPPLQTPAWESANWHQITAAELGVGVPGRLVRACRRERRAPRRIQL